MTAPLRSVREIAPLVRGRAALLGDEVRSLRAWGERAQQAPRAGPVPGDDVHDDALSIEGERAVAVGDRRHGEVEVPRRPKLLARPSIEDGQGANVLA